MALRSLLDDGAEHLAQLLASLRAQGEPIVRFPKVHPGEMPEQVRRTLGFRRAGAYRLYSATARPD